MFPGYDIRINGELSDGLARRKAGQGCNPGIVGLTVEILKRDNKHIAISDERRGGKPHKIRSVQDQMAQPSSLVSKEYIWKTTACRVLRVDGDRNTDINLVRSLCIPRP